MKGCSSAFLASRTSTQNRAPRSGASTYSRCCRTTEATKKHKTKIDPEALYVASFARTSSRQVFSHFSVPQHGLTCYGWVTVARSGRLRYRNGVLSSTTADLRNLAIFSAACVYTCHGSTAVLYNTGVSPPAPYLSERKQLPTKKSETNSNGHPTDSGVVQIGVRVLSHC